MKYSDKCKKICKSVRVLGSESFLKQVKERIAKQYSLFGDGNSTKYKS